MQTGRACSIGEYNKLLRIYGEQGNVKDAVRVFHVSYRVKAESWESHMWERDCSAILGALRSQMILVDLARSVGMVQDMRDRAVTPDAMTVTAVVTAAARAGKPHTPLLKATKGAWQAVQLLPVPQYISLLEHR